MSFSVRGLSYEYSRQYSRQLLSRQLLNPFPIKYIHTQWRIHKHLPLKKKTIHNVQNTFHLKSFPSH